MVRFSVLPAAAAVTLFLLGAQAGPCRPSTTTTSATSLAESSSTATSSDTTIATPSTPVADTSTTAETSLSGSSSTIASNTPIITPSTTPANTPTPTPVESTTTTPVPACVETQLFINPGFDNSNADIAPWTSTNGVITQNAPQSGANAVAFALTGGGYQFGSVTQTLSDLDGTYQFSYYYRVINVSPNADYTCDVQLQVGDTTARGDIQDTPGGWKSWTVVFSDLRAAQADAQLVVSCSGEFAQIQVAVDTLGFTRVCSG